MGRLSGRRRSRVTVASGGAAPALRGVVACAAVCAAFLLLAPAASARTHVPVPGGSGRRPTATAAVTGAADRARDSTAFRRIILPDLLVVAPAGLTSAEIARLGKTAHVRNMIVFDGAEITAGGHPASVIGVNPAQFRSWVPLRTASDQALWATLASGGFRGRAGCRPSARPAPRAAATNWPAPPGSR